jgi:hypothetical protein
MKNSKEPHKGFPKLPKSSKKVFFKDPNKEKI